jgi:predicted secreted protein
MLLRRKLFLYGVVLSVLLCFSLVSSAQASSNWNKTFGGTGNDLGRSLVATSDGGYAIAGVTDSFGAGGTDFWLIKTDVNGVMEWNRTYGGTGDDQAYSLVATSDGGYAIAGYTKSFGTGGGGIFAEAHIEVWLVKTDSLGNMQWNKTYGEPMNETHYSQAGAYALVTTSDGGYAIAGSKLYYIEEFEGMPLSIYSDFWLVKTDSLGNMQWNETYGLDFYSDVARSLVATSDGGYLMAGIGGGWADDLWLVKTDANGVMEWNRTYGGDAHMNDCAYSLIATSDGGYAIAGALGGISGDSDFWLVKTDAFGNMEWNQTYEGGWYDISSSVASYYSLVATSDGGCTIAGSTGSLGVGGIDLWLIKADENGVIPEYSSLLVPALVLTATAFIIIHKKRLLNKRSQKP